MSLKSLKQWEYVKPVVRDLRALDPAGDMS